MVDWSAEKHVTIAITRYIKHSALLGLSMSFWYTDYWFSTLMSFEDELLCDFKMDECFFDGTDWFGPRDIDVFAILLCSCREPFC